MLYNLTKDYLLNSTKTYINNETEKRIIFTFKCKEDTYCFYRIDVNDLTKEAEISKFKQINEPSIFDTGTYSEKFRNIGYLVSAVNKDHRYLFNIEWKELADAIATVRKN